LEEILAGIGNTLGIYVKASEVTKQRRYTSYARICVYLNISKPLPGSIDLEYQDEEWSQTIDYEHISFRCRKCHEHGHLFRDCPLNNPIKPNQGTTKKTKDGFVTAPTRQRQGPRKQVPIQTKTPSTNNSFEILNQLSDDLQEAKIIREIKGGGSRKAPKWTSPGTNHTQYKDHTWRI
jgi:hypothetical protein